MRIHPLYSHNRTVSMRFSIAFAVLYCAPLENSWSVQAALHFA